MSSAEELKIYRSSAIPSGVFVHGFPERTGGVSTGARASLNLGGRWGDDPVQVTENRRRVGAKVGFALEDLMVTRHVHGPDVWRVGEPEPAEYDGLVCNVAGKVLGAFAADCIPMVVADPSTRLCGAAHAGWRGTVAGIGRNMITAMIEGGANIEQIRVALGPCIGVCCFEVGPEVVAAFVARFGNLHGLVQTDRAKPHLDLRCAMRAELELAGVRPEHIDSDPPCTKCNPERFFSYRRDGKDGGCHMGFIGLVG